MISTIKNQSMKLPKILITAICIICTTGVFGQVAKGTVQTEESEAIVGAIVINKANSAVAVTKADGSFEIIANEGDTLLVRSMGFKPNSEVTRMTPGMPAQKIHLIEATKALEDVVVIGYGTQKRGEVTGAISTINSENLDNTSVSFDNGMAGKAAGVQVLSSSGTPGSATSMIIRGLSTINSDANNPLIVIDGVPVYGTGKDINNIDFSGGITATTGSGSQVVGGLPNKQEFERNPLAHLNPDDIESIEILKDAFATAIYGSRGATGVILITTKKGRSIKPRVNFHVKSGVADPVDLPQMLNAQEYSDFYTDFITYKNQSAVPFPTPVAPNFSTDYETNWLDEVTRQANYTEANIDFSGNAGKHSFYISGGYTKQDSYIRNNDYDRYNGRINFSNDASSKLHYGSNITLSFSDNNALNAQQIYRNAILKAPNLPIRNPDGSYLYTNGSNSHGPVVVNNPVAMTADNTNFLRDTRTIGNVFAEFKPFDWLKLHSEFGVDWLNSRGFTRLPDKGGVINGEATENTGQLKKHLVNTYAEVNKGVADHLFNLTLGHSFEKSNENTLRVYGQGFLSDEVNSISSARNSRVLNDLSQKWALESFFGRFNYQFQQKYLAGVTFRTDGSSRFNKNNRYIGFPSFSLGWRISEENFLKESETVNELKLRASLGFSGIQSSGGYYGNQGQFVLHPSGLTYASTPIIELKQPSNPNLEWERSRALDIGLDAVLLKNRLDITIDYYRKRIKNMLYPSAVPLYQGWQIQDQNIGDMENKGLELALNSVNIKNDDFSWSTSLNIARNTNELLKLNFEGEDVQRAELGYKYFKVGEPIDQFILYDWIGVNPENGNPQWLDKDGNVTETPPASLIPVDNANRRPFGTSLPNFFGGFTNTFNYKGFGLNAHFTFSSGSKMLNGTRATLLTYLTNDTNNLGREILNYWQAAGDNTDIPALDNDSVIKSGFGPFVFQRTDYTAARNMSRFLEDNSYLRLKTINAKYRFPQSFYSKWGNMRNLELYLEGTNLLTLTGYSGVDPEVSAFGSSGLLNGFDELTLPQSKSVSMGLRFGF